MILDRATALEKVPEVQSKRALKKFILSSDMSERYTMKLSMKLKLRGDIFLYFVNEYGLRDYLLHYETVAPLVTRGSTIDFIVKYYKKLNKKMPIKYKVIVKDKNEKIVKLSIVLLGYNVVIQTESDLASKVEGVKTIFFTTDNDFEDIISLSKLKLKLCKLINHSFPIYEKEIKDTNDIQSYIETARSIPQDTFRRLLYLNIMNNYDRENQKLDYNNLENLNNSSMGLHKLIIQKLVMFSKGLSESNNIIENLLIKLGRLR